MPKANWRLDKTDTQEVVDMRASASRHRTRCGQVAQASCFKVSMNTCSIRRACANRHVVGRWPMPRALRLARNGCAQITMHARPMAWARARPCLDESSSTHGQALGIPGACQVVGRQTCTHKVVRGPRCLLGNSGTHALGCTPKDSRHLEDL